MLPGMASAIGGVSAFPQLSLTYVSSAGQSLGITAGGNSSLGTVSLGEAPPSGSTRYIIVATHGDATSTTGRMTSVTIAGNAATRLYFRSNTDAYLAELWYLENNVLTSGEVVVVPSTNQDSFAISVWNLTNPASITPHASAIGFSGDPDAGEATVSATVPEGGVGMGLFYPRGVTNGISWTNATEQYEVQSDPNQYPSGALATASGTYDITATPASNPGYTIVAAHSWAPISS